MDEKKKFKELLKYIETGNNKQAKRILEDSSFNPTLDDNEAIKVAIDDVRGEITKMLLNDPRVSNSVNYEELIELAKSSTKVILKMVEDSYELYKMRNLNNLKPTSPVEYKTARKIIKPHLFGISKIEDFQVLLEKVKIERFEIKDLKKVFGSYFKPIISVFPKNDLIKSKEFKTFLCDFELFNWKSGESYEDTFMHRTRFDISYRMIYPLFTTYLSRLLGNDLTLFTLNTSSVYQEINVNELYSYNFGDLKIKNFFDVEGCSNRIYNFPQVLNMDLKYLIDPLRTFGLEYWHYYEVINVLEFKTKCGKENKEIFLYNLNYCDSLIKEKSTRYSLSNCIINYEKRGNHYTFLFIDHELKIVEYYDPYVILNKTECNLFIYKSLQEIFKEYTVNKFWESLSIQKTEEFEKDETAFCVKWGHMMMHLKLLNLNIPIIEIEKKFILECKNKNISLYEVMLNYTYFMRRIIPKNGYKFVKLRKLLMF